MRRIWLTKKRSTQDTPIGSDNKFGSERVRTSRYYDRPSPWRVLSGAVHMRDLPLSLILVHVLYLEILRTSIIRAPGSMSNKCIKSTQWPVKGSRRAVGRRLKSHRLRPTGEQCANHQPYSRSHLWSHRPSGSLELAGQL